MTAARWLQEDGEEEVVSDSQVLKETFMIYGPLFAAFWLLFCCLRKRKAFNLRSWVPALQCDLAKEQYGFLSWTWRVYGVSDDEILNQCGMDALCLFRAVCYAEKLSILGVLISVFLLPAYKTAEAAQDTDYITDPVVELTIANVPEGSSRFYATVVAIYIFYLAAWYWLAKDFDWFTRRRNEFLSQPKPRNYSIYVRGIPRKYRSNEALSAYFEKLFSENAVFQANVALDIPRLQQKVAKRETVVQKLEHCLALQAKGQTPTHHDGPFGNSVDSIDTYKEQLQELNAEISSEITRIEESSVARQESFHSCEEKDSELDRSNHSQQSQSIEWTLSKSMPTNAGLSTGDPGDASRAKSWAAPLAKASPYFGVANNTTCTDVQSLENSSDAPVGSTPSKHDISDLDSSHAATPDDNIRAKISSHGQELKHAVTKAVPFLHGEDGVPFDAGFVSFTSLTDTNAAIQVIHSIVPYEMVVQEAPNHEGILWKNVGLNHKTIQLGTLFSFVLAAGFCLFYTVPVSFALSLTSAEALAERWPALEDALERAPWLGPLLDQIGPLLLSTFDSILPMILKVVASFEGAVGESHLEASLFSKLSAFHIIQTFIVANVAGSITQGLEYFWNDPTQIVQFLAVQLPPQSTFYIQLVWIDLVFGLGFECLRIFPLLQVWLRETFGPHLTEKERNRIWHGLRPLSNPRPFFHARVFASTVLYLMVCFVYTAIAPITCYVLAFCFFMQGAAYRNQLFYVYSTNPDSGGMLWMRFVNIAMICMLVAQLTLGAYLLLKKANVAAGLMVPLIVFQILFHIYIRQRHFQAARRLPAEDSLQLDADGPADFGFLEDSYKQSALKTKELEPDTDEPAEGDENEDSPVENIESTVDEEQGTATTAIDDTANESHEQDRNSTSS